MEKNQQKKWYDKQKKWYDNRILTNILLIVFFPVGLYALWKSNTIAMWWKVTATVIIILFIIGNAGSDVDSLSAKKQLASAEPVKELTQAEKDSLAAVERARTIEKRENSTFLASELLAAYEENEVKADQLFKDKRLYVEGYVEEINKDIFDNAYVNLKTNKQFYFVSCYLQDENSVADLQKGMKVTFYGTCSGRTVTDVSVKECKLVENKENL